MDLNLFTLVHILISLAGILSGLLVVGGWMAGKHYHRLTQFFLATTFLTSVTGFFFPLKGITPAVIFGILSLILLAAAAYALYGANLQGIWQRTYLITALIALYLNFFVLVAQLFAKTPALKALAPNQSEPPFGASQFLVLIFFVAIGIPAVRNFRRTA